MTLYPRVEQGVLTRHNNKSSWLLPSTHECKVCFRQQTPREGPPWILRLNTLNTLNNPIYTPPEYSEHYGYAEYSTDYSAFYFQDFLDPPSEQTHSPLPRT